MRKVATHNEYEYWVGVERDNRIYYNITKAGTKKPDSGYFDRNYILEIKKVPDLFPTEQVAFNLLTQ